jgi:hypothetical protein
LVETRSTLSRVESDTRGLVVLDWSSSLSNDPDFEEKLVDIVGLYLNPP